MASSIDRRLSRLQKAIKSRMERREKRVKLQNYWDSLRLIAADLRFHGHKDAARALLDGIKKHKASVKD